jgi:hypothetical protein
MEKLKRKLLHRESLELRNIRLLEISFGILKTSGGKIVFYKTFYAPILTYRAEI